MTKKIVRPGDRIEIEHLENVTIVRFVRQKFNVNEVRLPGSEFLNIEVEEKKVNTNKGVNV